MKARCQRKNRKQNLGDNRGRVCFAYQAPLKIPWSNWNVFPFQELRKLEGVVQNHGTRDQIGSMLVHELAPKFWAAKLIWVVVSNIFYVHPYLGKISNLTNIFRRGWNHQLVMDSCFSSNTLLVKLVFNWTFFWQGDETGLKQRFGLIIWTCLTLQGVADPSKQLAGSIGMSQCPI